MDRIGCIIAIFCSRMTYCFEDGLHLFLNGGKAFTGSQMKLLTRHN